MESSINVIPMSSGEPEEPEENITYMDASLYKAAAESNIEVFNNKQGHQLESLKTPNHDNVLHVNLATHELAAWFSNGILSRTRSFPNLYLFIYLFLWIFIIKKKSKKRSDFIEHILTKCPSLLLQTNAKGQTPLHVAARNGHSAIVQLLIRSCAKARDEDLEKLGMDQVGAVRQMLRIKDQESNTALHEAAQYGDVEMVEELLKLEHPVERLLELENRNSQYSVNKNQETPLYLAAMTGDERLLTVILNKWKSADHHGGPHGRTTLHATTMAEDEDATSKILEKQEDLRKKEDKDGHTPLHYAAHIGCNSVVEVLLEKDVSAAYKGDKKLGMTPLLVAARQGNVGTVKKILSKCPDCCERVDKRGLNLLHYLAFRDRSFKLSHSLFMPGGTKTEYGSLRNLRKLKGAFGFTPEQVYALLRYEGHNKKYRREKKQIEKLLKKIASEEVAELQVSHIPLPTVSTKSLEKTRDAHLVVAALIATITFAAAITVPGGLNTEKGSEQGTPFLIDEAAFKAFVVTNAMAFILSVSALSIHFEILDPLLPKLEFWGINLILYRTQSVSNLLGRAMFAMVVAFSTSSYVVLKPSHGLAIASCFICPGFFVCYYVQQSLAFVKRLLQ
ncbi:ankyrin repeat-containing protein ITN1-like isoform X2 [Gossypium arboreum]|uniref:ankyrin repeat-containing protein ITN1-like isoform X2 n=1 Tax=Gossypium arboreum TaxID=29729 RepID=UPI0022F15B96|nr:ankyrin repeat-containing protein ITN1-like isoform X2 [Gossypium arboreum]